MPLGAQEREVNPHVVLVNGSQDFEGCRSAYKKRICFGVTDGT